MNEQAEFAAALLQGHCPPGLHTWNNSAAEQRFAVYRNNYLVGLIEALADTFTVTQALVGVAFFQAMARVFVQTQPAQSPLLVGYGEGFGEFIDSFPPAAGLYALTLVYRAARAIPGLGPLADRIPFHQYSDQSFRKLWITALDHLTTPIVHYYRREDMEAWLERAGLEDRVVSERWAGRAGSTWRICGTRPAVAAPAGG